MSETSPMPGANPEILLRATTVRPGDVLAVVIRLRDDQPQADGWTVRLLIAMADRTADELVIAAHRAEVPDPPNTAREWSFTLQVPFEAPLCVGTGIAGALVDAGIDQARHTCEQLIRVDPLPAQAEVLTALSGLGFEPWSTRIEPGWLRGMQQDLPFHQVIEFDDSTRFPGLTGLEVSFLTGEDGVEVVWQVRTDGRERCGVFYLDHADVDTDEVAAVVAAELAAI